MTKSKTIIAGLGVVAALGVAALPLCSYAANRAQVSGDVLLGVEVLPAISMTIAGNNDDNSKFGTASTNSAIDIYSDSAGNAGTVDGHTVSANGTHTSSTDTSVTPNMTTYLTTAAKASSSYIALTPNASAHGSDSNGFKSTIKVYTNNNTGYTLNVKDTDGTLTLTNAAGDTIAVNDGKVVAGTAGWGYAIDTAVATDWTTGDANYKPITASDALVKTKATKTTNGEETTVYYGVSTASDQPGGLYQNTLTYTATTNN